MNSPFPQAVSAMHDSGEGCPQTLAGPPTMQYCTPPNRPAVLAGKATTPHTHSTGYVEPRRTTSSREGVEYACCLCCQAGQGGEHSAGANRHEGPYALQP
jgi:hypothetical protein